jgi:hypothetical protein
MKNMTSRELNKKIKELKTELAKELNENGTSKRTCFLAATINLYTEKLNK